MTEHKPEAPALGFSIQAEINKKRTVVVQSHLPATATGDEIFEMWDKCCRQLDRLDTRYRLHDLKVVLEVDEKEFADKGAAVGKLATAYENEWTSGNRKGPFKPTMQQQANLDNQHNFLVELKKRIERTKKEIAEAEAIVKG